MRETLPSARSDGAPLCRFSTLYTGMKGFTGLRADGIAPKGSWVGNTRVEQNLDKIYIFQTRSR